MKLNYLIVISTALVLALVIYLAYHLHQVSVEEVVSQFEEHQLLVARHTAAQIKSYLQDRSEEMKLLMTFESFRQNDRKQIQKDIFDYFERVKIFHVKSVSVYDEKGTITYSTSPMAIGRSHASCDFFLWAKQPENKNGVFISSLLRIGGGNQELPQHFRCLLVIPLYEEVKDKRQPKPTSIFAGALTVSIDLQELLNNLLAQVNSPSSQKNQKLRNAELNQAWLIDNDGRLIYSSHHPEMLLQNVHDTDATCQQCHVSFEHLYRALRERQGTTYYQHRDAPKKLAAFTQINYENISWIVGVHAPYDEVTAFTTRNLQVTLLLLGLVIIALVGSSTILYRNNVLRLKAEEEVKRQMEKQVLEEKIQQTKNHLEGILNSSLDLILSIKKDGTIAYINLPSEKTTGYSQKQVIGKHFLDFIPPHRKEFMMEKWQEANGGISSMFETEIIKADGSLMHCLVSYSIIEEFDEFLVTLKDITEHKKAEEALQKSESRYRMLIDTAPVVIYTINIPDGIITSLNPAFETITGWKREEWIGKSFTSLIHPDDLPLALQTTEQVSRGETPPPYELRVRTKSGNYLVGELTSTPIIENGVVVGEFGIARDITKRKRAEELLEASERSYRGLFNTIEDAIYIQDADGKFLDVNEGAVKMYGYPREFFIGKTPEPLSAPGKNDLVATWEAIKRAFAGEPQRFEWWGKHKNGKVFPKEVRLTKGLYLGKDVIIAIARDITEQKAREETLRATEQKLRQILENSTIMFYSHTPENLLTYVSPQSRVFLGCEPEEAMGQWTEFITDNPVNAKGIEATKQAIETGKAQPPYQLELRKKNGEIIWVEVHEAPVVEDGKTIAIVGSLTDITERKRAELLQDAVYKISQATIKTTSLDELYKSIHEIISTVMPAKNFYIALYDDKKDLISFPYFVDEFDAVFPPMKLGKGLTAYVIRTGKSLLCDEATDKELRRLGEVDLIGTYSPIWLGVPLNVENKTIGVMVVQHYTDPNAFGMRELHLLEYVSTQIARAIERRRAEEALLEAEKKYRSIFENAVEGIFQSTPDGRFITVNHSLARMFGYGSPEEMLTSITDIGHQIYVNPQRRAELLSLIAKKGIVEGFVIEAYHRDGSIIWLSLNARAVRNESGAILYIEGMIENITQQRIIEQQLIQSQKLESLGTLASGIAHDFNNILAIILGHTGAMGRAQGDQSKLSQSIDAINKATLRGASLVKQLLTFARKTETVFESVRVNDIVMEIKKLMQETFPKTITISTDLQENLPSILGSSAQVHQVLLNLCVNARDAMPRGGTLSISTRTVYGNKLAATHPTVTEREYVEIQVTDTGTGMDEATRQRIFEPFFSTKGPGKGTGLGLAIVYGIVESHRGIIDCESKVGKGTTFRVYFPVKEPTLETFELSDKTIQDVPGGTETILFVEDEIMLRELVETVLTSKGYTVLTASDGEEGLKVFQDHQNEIAVVLSDMGLPKSSGEELFWKIKAIDPKAKVILSSGFIEPNVRSELFKAGVKHFIQKPYLPEEVLTKIREVIDLK